MDDQAIITTNGNADLPESTPERPLVTFALFAYNQEKYIREAVEGAFSQTYEPLEIILSDDCSSDRTFEIMQEMAAQYKGPHRILVNQTVKNKGVASHINSVTSISSGDFIVIGAGDDISHPNRVKLLTEKWINSARQALAVESWYRPIDAVSNVMNGKFTMRSVRPSDLLHFAKVNDFITGATAAYDRRVFSDFPPLDANVVHEDRVLPFRALLLGGKLDLVPETLVDYRQDVGVSANYRGGKGHNSGVFARRVLSDNLQKLQDAQYLSNPHPTIMLSRNIRRYAAEVYATDCSSGIKPTFELMKYSGIYWGLRAFIKYKIYPKLSRGPGKR